MHLMFASGEYPWAIVPLERRAEYMVAIESAGVGGDIKPFAEFLVELAKSDATIIPSTPRRKNQE